MPFETAFTMDTSSIKYGSGVTREVGWDMRRLGGTRVMVVTDPYLSGSEPVAVTLAAPLACAATGTWIELNCNPYRFDLDWRLWPYAKTKGVKCVINPDAHRNEHAGFLRLGVGVARKGWLTKADVINTLPLEKLRKELAKKRGG